MIVKIGETKTQSLRDCTLNGVVFNVYLSAAVAGTAITLTDWLPQNVQVNTILSRNGKDTRITGDNLNILGLYSSLNYGISQWLNGTTLVANAPGVTQIQLMSVLIHFGEHINVKGDDSMDIQVQLTSAAFGATISGAVSYIEFNPNFSIGYEYGTPRIVAKVVQANIPSEKYAFGNGVIKAAFLNFDQTDYTNQLITSAQINSKQLSNSYDWFDCINRDLNDVVSPVRSQYFAANPLSPMSFVLHCGTKDNKMVLDGCSISAAYLAGNINAGKNYWVATMMEITKDLVVKAENRATKHAKENIAALPTK